ncbi:hypothetical protein RND81_04G053600 [Saponaria officinalis]|uniref:Replication protein A 70 kDa DNA-binding subunit B/D first OB fold domain-containing protein n=1 Tax=Saponaria officinalis TaxID=3572 RepID=A0AAW1LCY8_SAPOF
MTFNNKSVMIADLQKGMRNVELGVRVIRKWKTYNDIRENWQKGLELLLMDENSTIIQASIPKTLSKRFDQAIVEGKMYNFSKFIVEPNICDDDKATTADLKLDIGYSTNVIEALNLPIPMYGFRFTPFEDIINQHVDESTYIGKIGTHSVKNYTWTKIELEDTKNRRLTCSVWGDYCKDVQKIATQYTYNARGPIIIIKCCKRSDFRGTIIIPTHSITLNSENNTQILNNLKPYAPQVRCGYQR